MLQGLSIISEKTIGTLLKNSNKKGLTDNIRRLLAGGEFDEKNNFSGHYLGQTHLIFFSANSIKLKPNHAIKKNSSNYWYGRDFSSR